MIGALEDDGVGFEEEVENGVGEGGVDAREQDDGLEGDHVERPHEGYRDHLLGALFVEFDGGEDVWVGQFLAEALGAFFEDDGPVGFGEEDEDKKAEACYYQGDPKGPAPGYGGDEARYEGGEHGARSGCLSSLLANGYIAWSGYDLRP